MNKLLSGLVLILTSLGVFADVPAYYERFSGADLLGLLKQVGLETQIKSMGDGVYLVPVRVEGKFSTLVLYGCESSQCTNISSVQAVAQVDAKGHGRAQLLHHLNAFNNDYPYGRAWLRDDGMAVFELDMNTSHGVASARIGAFLGNLSALQDAFESHMAELPKPDVSPPPPVLTPPEFPESIQAASQPSRFLSVSVTAANNQPEGCVIQGQIKNDGEQSYAFMSASFSVHIKDEPSLKYVGFNAGKGFVKDKAGPLDPGDTGTSTATLKAVKCEHIETLVFEDIAFCGNEPPFTVDCTDFAQVIRGGPFPLIDKPNRLLSDPVPILDSGRH